MICDNAAARLGHFRGKSRKIKSLRRILLKGETEYLTNPPGDILKVPNGTLRSCRGDRRAEKCL